MKFFSLLYMQHYKEMMMSVLQEIKGLAKDSLYFPGGSPVSMQNFRSPHYHFVLMKEGVSVILYIGECI